MTNRVSASIAIGGMLPANLLSGFVKAVESEALSTEWGGEPFTIDDMPEGRSLHLMAHEVAWGRFEELESFCVEHGLPFARWSGAYSCEWGAERVVFTGSGEPQSYEADDNDNIVFNREVVDRLGMLEAIQAHLDTANFPIPPLVVIAHPQEANNG